MPFKVKKFILTLIFFLLIIPLHKNTLLKVNQFYDVSFLYENMYLKGYHSIKNSLIIKKDEKDNISEIKDKVIEKLPRKNLSVEVMINNLKIAIISFKENLFGWGLHNYKYAHKFYIEKVNTSNVVGSSWLNSTDGSNNFSKGLVEFGILFLIPLILIFILLIDKRINIEENSYISNFIFTNFY